MTEHFTCSWCGRDMLITNKSRHLSTCLFKNELKATKEYIIKLVEDNPNQSDQISLKKEKLEMANVDLMKVVEDTYLKFRDLREKYIGGESEETAEEKIQGMNVCGSTKVGYLVEWRKFKKWKDANSRTISVASMNQYLQTLKCKTSTLWKKRNILERILKTLVDANMKLEPMRQRFSTKPKYSMTEKDIKEYLDEQMEVNEEDYLIQKIMITLSLRIGTIASLKLQNFDMLKENKLVLPDTKSKKTNVREVDEDLQEKIGNFLREADLEDDDYVFYRGGRYLNIARRSQALSNRINDRIRKSKYSNSRRTSNIRRTCLENVYRI